MEDFLIFHEIKADTQKKTKLLSLSEICSQTVANEINDSEDLDGYIKNLKEYPSTCQELILKKVHLHILRSFFKDESYSYLLQNKNELETRCLHNSEIHYRKLFADESTSPELDDHHLLLINPYNSGDFETEKEFEYKEWDEGEKEIPKILQLENYFYRKAPKDGCAIVPKYLDFKKRWKHFTHGVFSEFDWNNVLAAGGGVLAPLLPFYENENQPNDQTEYQQFHNYTFRNKLNFYQRQQEKFKSDFFNSDIDLFIYGLSEEEATKKAVSLIRSIMTHHPLSEKIDIIKTKYVISLTTPEQFPTRKIQVILRLYRSPAEILLGFDVDSCAVGYDGQDVWISERARRAITKQYNLIDLSRRSPSYEYRLLKYARRGFCVAVPNMKKELINPDIYTCLFSELKGLAKLLLFEKLPTKLARLEHLKKISGERSDGLVVVVDQKKEETKENVKFVPNINLGRKQRRYYGYNNNNNNVLHVPVDFVAEYATSNSGYSWYEPVDLIWDNLDNSIWEILNRKSCLSGKILIWDVNNSKSARSFKYTKGKYLNSVLRGIAKQKPRLTNYNYRYRLNSFINNQSSENETPIQLEWITENPGRQELMSGSFQQQDIDDDEWLTSAYQEY
ncbi:putative reductase [Anaeramoeba flamelloides]|uniref:Reductase n=1 Tax=Anaeramoeba flamelloides TaxID=1746091 RepID=A0AAV7ZXR9_9EUKA|nr:putative reductase [Anaeramoeba flamelloides]|eukprot:Anaeramoba_flamelloidesa1062477_161.p1 GENE.a1062477_161~~a1062477_161.p1  ORF type:complete len:620 (-),score=148.92 a1062477_161:171-2030(-)